MRFSGVRGVRYTLLSRTGIRYQVRHLDITGDDRDAATGDGGRRAMGGPFAKGTRTCRRDVRPLSCSAVPRRRDKGERRFVRREIGFCG